MGSKLIVLNGKTYRSIEEMPPDIREKYELAMNLLGIPDQDAGPGSSTPEGVLVDRNKNGIPDIIENVTATDVVVQNTRIIVDGKELDSVEDLPPEARARYETAMHQLDKNGNGIPDFVEGMVNITNQTTNIPTSPATQAHTPSDNPTTMPDTEVSNGWKLALLGLFLFLACLAGSWYFFLR